MSRRTLAQRVAAFIVEEEKRIAREQAAARNKPQFVRKSYKVSSLVVERVRHTSLVLAGVPSHSDWTTRRIVQEALELQLARIRRAYGTIPVSHRRLQRGRLPGGPKKRPGNWSLLTVSIPAELDDQVKDALFLLRRYGKRITQNDFVEQGLIRLIRKLAQELNPS